jgi:ferredoxin
MKNKFKIIIPVLLVSSSLFVLFQNKNNTPLNTNTNLNSKNSNLAGSTDKNTVSVDLKKLSVLENRCRGCGKCAQIDPSHFEMVNRVAQVISSTNLTSQNLASAINMCPGQAIILE